MHVTPESTSDSRQDCRSCTALLRSPAFALRERENCIIRRATAGLDQTIIPRIPRDAP